MSDLSSKELRQHQFFATCLLIFAVVLWAVAAIIRLQEKWIAEYLKAMIFTAGLALAIAATWHLVIWVKRTSA